jgi:tetratricopeptide (TPR) repeat protein
MPSPREPRGRRKGGPPPKKRASGGRARPRSSQPPRDDRAGPKHWGGVARKGAGRLKDDRPSQASDAFREAAGLPEDDHDRQPRTDTWIRVDDDIRAEAAGAIARGKKTAKTTPRRQREAPTPSAAELEEIAGTSHIPKLGERLRNASRAFERERFTEARKLLKPLAERAPGSAPVRELNGLTFYRLGQWRNAARELEAFKTLTGSTEQNPVLADCYRALRRYREVDALWKELAEASPSAEAVAEGRIVAAGALADRGELDHAIRLLEAGQKPAKRMRPHHLRVLYALADLVERAGDIPRARTLFTRVANADPDFADVTSRLRSLG